MIGGKLIQYQKTFKWHTFTISFIARQLENEKLNRMFGGKSEMKKIKKRFKDKHNR
jgi:hypothetical protein